NLSRYLRGRIQNNICYHNGTFGIQLWHAANKVIVSNNLLFNNGAKTDKGNFVGGGILSGAGDLPGGVTLDNTTVSNNMVIYNRGAGIREYGTTGSGNRYLKNLLFGPAGSQVLKSLEVAANKYYRWDDFLGQFLAFSGGGALLFQSASGVSSSDKFTVS